MRKKSNRFAIVKEVKGWLSNIAEIRLKRGELEEAQPLYEESRDLRIPPKPGIVRLS